VPLDLGVVPPAYSIPPFQGGEVYRALWIRGLHPRLFYSTPSGWVLAQLSGALEPAVRLMGFKPGQACRGSPRYYSYLSADIGSTFAALLAGM